MQGLNAQGIAINEWRTHLPFNSCISVADTEDKVYCATNYAVFSYNKQDQSVERLTKVNMLSDMGVSRLKYSKTHKILIITYTNGNIDLIEKDQVINISDIKRKIIPGNKSINNILLIGNYAYLSCGFGIVVMDLVKKEITDTYYIGPNGSHIEVNDLACDGLNLYAATESGLYKASVSNPFLANYQSWTKYSEMPNPNGNYNKIAIFNNEIIINLLGSSYNTDTLYSFDGLQWKYFINKEYSATRYRLDVYDNALLIVSENGVEAFDTTHKEIWKIWTYNPGYVSARDAVIDYSDSKVCWIADNSEGLVRTRDIYSSLKITLNGPGTTNAFAMSAEGGNLWVAAGGLSSTWNNMWNHEGIFSFIDESWNVYNSTNVEALDTIYDFVAITVNPSNPSKAYAGSWINGLVEFTDKTLTAVFNETNSTLTKNGAGTKLQIGGICFDKQNNMWVSNSNSATNHALCVRTYDNKWYSFDFTGIVNGEIGSVIIDDYNQKWAILPRNVGIVVFNDNKTINNFSDDKLKKLSSTLGSGNLPSNNVFSIAKDRDGEIWVGTDKGIAVFYTPDKVFSGSNFDSQQILVEQGGHLRPLLESETVTSIAVDGANRKWLGTSRAGVFLVSADGTEQLLHFTEDNSPLLSNTINCISINQKTGEVYFGTAKGIISFKYNSTEGKETFSEVYAYPNPVRENYFGTIAIKGLVTDADVKITDITGTLIYSTKANGGQAVWDGKNFEGIRAKTGVYLVYSSNEDGTETLVTKILFIN